MTSKLHLLPLLPTCLLQFHSPRLTSLFLSFLFSFPFHTLLAIPASSHSHPCFKLADSFVFLPCLSYPSSTPPGCGQPSFQIHCSSNNSIISINNSNFSIISYKPYSLNVSPYSLNVSLFHCNSSLPIHPINLSSTPFRISSTTCFKLNLPPNNKSCPDTASSRCNVTTDSQNKFLGSLPGCNRTNPKQKHSVCSILQFLKSEIELELDPKSEFFSSCVECEKLKEPHKSSRNHIALTTVLFVITCFSLVSAVAVMIFGCRGWRSKAGEEDPTAVFLHRHRSSHLLPPVFTYEELDCATNRFDPKRKIGDGGFGSVYLAQLSDGQIVAVKRLHRRHAAPAVSSKSFCNEILILSSISHPSLVRLHGYCSDPRGLILVYDYVPNGTLADHLHGSKSHSRRTSLTWPVRVDVALQTAMAIEYLHFAVAPAVVHRDITSSNIFVERDMRVKLGDFGLSRLLVFTEPSATYVCTGPQGTPGYLDPEYHRSFRLTEKSDVYSFGVVLFELISGMKAVDLRREKREVALADLVVGKIQVGELRQVVDPVLEEEEAMGTVDAVAELAFRCVAVDKDDRPDAREVVAELRRIRSRLRGQKP